MSSTLSQRRRAVGLSQQKLASLAGCSISMVSLLERGLTPDQSDVRDRIEEVLGAHSAQHGGASPAPTDPVGEPRA